MRGIPPRAGARTARKAARAAHAQTAREEGGCFCSAEPLELLERSAEHNLVVRIGERECGFVRTAETCPELRRPVPLPCDLRRVGLCRKARNLLVHTGAPSPERELAGEPLGLMLLGQL